MNGEVPYKTQIDHILVENHYGNLPLEKKEVKQVILLLKENVFGDLEKNQRRKIIATIFLYLSQGSEESTHASGKREGKIKTGNPRKGRARRRSNPRSMRG